MMAELRDCIAEDEVQSSLPTDKLNLNGTNDPEVSIVIVNYNEPNLTKTCLQNLWERTTVRSYEIIVVDNGSTMENCVPLRMLDGPAKVVRLDVHRTFGEANNIGAEAARGEFVVFLNNGALVSSGWLEPLVERLKNQERLGAVSPHLIYPGGDECGGFICQDGYVVRIGNSSPYSKYDIKDSHIVDCCNADCMVVSKELFFKVGAFDYVYEDKYYSYLDVCMRINRHGLLLGYCSRSRVVLVKEFDCGKGGELLGLSSTVDINRAQFLNRWGARLRARDAAMLAKGAELPTVSSNPACERPRAVFYTPFAITPGGGERYLLTAALALAADFEVYLVLDEVYSNARMAAVGRDLDLDLSPLKMIRRRNIGDLRKIDLCVMMGNEALPPLPPLALSAIYICQFPFPLPVEERVRRSANLHGFSRVIVYSAFVEGHIRKALALEGVNDLPVEVIAPPVPLAPEGTRSAALGEPYRFVMVGRFFTGGHTKRHDVAIELIRRLTARGVPVELDLVGSIASGDQHREYYRRLQALAKGLPVNFTVNATNEDLRVVLSRAHIYIHAAGYEVDETTEPHACEHFGISVLEAMSYGLVPFVVANGGPATFVEHGVSGYHYRGLDDLEESVLAALAAPDQFNMIRYAAAMKTVEFAENVFAQHWRRVAAAVAAAAVLPIRLA